VKASPARLAVIGALFHAPGLKLFARAQLSPLTVVLNAFAAALTVGAMAWAWTSGHSVVLAWLCGHLGWSCTVAVLAMRGHVRSSA
jgi:hypothetical protein